MPSPLSYSYLTPDPLANYLGSASLASVSWSRFSSGPVPSVITVSTGESFATPLAYTVRCVKDVFNKKAPDFHRAQALYQIFIEVASELETTSQFNAVMARIAENLESLGCKKKPLTVAIPIPCPIAHNDLCTKEHVPTRPSTPIPSLTLPNKRPLIDSSSTRQMKRKHFKSSKKRKPIKTEDTLEDTCATLAARYGSEPEMDSDGFFPNPIHGLREALDDFMNEDPNDNSSVIDREIREFDRDYPFAGQSYETPQDVSPPAAPPTVTPVVPLPPNTSLLLPKVALPRARTEPPLPTASKTSIPLRAQTAPPDVSRNTLTARRCTNKDASPSSFVKFMDVPVTMTREHIHDCLKDNRKWSMVDISNVEIFAIKNKDSTVVNVLKIKFKDDAQSSTAKRKMPTMVSLYKIQLAHTLQTPHKHRLQTSENTGQQQSQGNNVDNISVTSIDNISVNNGQSP
ncbi:hypothetical protein JOM56_004299 [Amanita muscaria]